ncbi:hypothetical protein NUW54_g11330 [Trametes sanguinea]|uniref:Uncharacterized protein n=1 Tax=Trametes sanguinea TaxID=158606 RepID=A0ACC1NGM3_9APHY|nr:hypothetical protein NUW54_g11330 [Trametes sanguinea]
MSWPSAGDERPGEYAILSFRRARRTEAAGAASAVRLATVLPAGLQTARLVPFKRAGQSASRAVRESYNVGTAAPSLLSQVLRRLVDLLST